MSSEGNEKPGFMDWICGSFHFLILSKNMSARIVPVSFSPLFGRLGILYTATTAPIVSGICTAPESFCCSTALRGASEAIKSTVLAVNCLTPPPLPID